MMREAVLEFVNKTIRSEKGSRVIESSKMVDANLDSFGTVMFYMAIDGKYGYFAKAGYSEDDDAFKFIDHENITIDEVINTCLSETTSI